MVGELACLSFEKESLGGTTVGRTNSALIPRQRACVAAGGVWGGGVARAGGGGLKGVVSAQFRVITALIPR